MECDTIRGLHASEACCYVLVADTNFLKGIYTMHPLFISCYSRSTEGITPHLRNINRRCQLIQTKEEKAVSVFAKEAQIVTTMLVRNSINERHLTDTSILTDSGTPRGRPFRNSNSDHKSELFDGISSQFNVLVVIVRRFCGQRYMRAVI